MAQVEELTETASEQALGASETTLVDFWAPWCGPCRMVAPVVEALARKYSGRLKVLKVNVDDEPALASRYQVQGIPTLAFFRKGKLLGQLVGAVPQAQLEKAVEQVLATKE
jgi:thioredoxin